MRNNKFKTSQLNFIKENKIAKITMKCDLNEHDLRSNFNQRIWSKLIT